MILVLIVFVIASIINWKIAKKKQSHCWRDEGSRRKNQKKSIFVVIHSDAEIALLEVLVAVSCVLLICGMAYYGQTMTNSIRIGMFIINIITFAIGFSPYSYEICFDNYTICRRVFNRRKYWNLNDIKYCKVKIRTESRWGSYPVIYVYMKDHMLPSFYVSKQQFGFMRFLRCMKFVGKRNSKKSVRPIVPLIGKEKLDDYFLRRDL